MISESDSTEWTSGTLKNIYNSSSSKLLFPTDREYIGFQGKETMQCSDILGKTFVSDL